MFPNSFGMGPEMLLLYRYLQEIIKFVETLSERGTSSFRLKDVSEIHELATAQQQFSNTWLPGDISLDH